MTIFLPISSHFSLILFSSRIISTKRSFSLNSMRRAFSDSGSIAGAFFSQSNISASLSAFDHCHGYYHILCCSCCTDSSGCPCLPDMRYCLDCADLRNGSVVLCCGCCPISTHNTTKAAENPAKAGKLTIKYQSSCILYGRLKWREKRWLLFSARPARLRLSSQSLRFVMFRILWFFRMRWQQKIWLYNAGNPRPKKLFKNAWQGVLRRV